MTHAVFHPKLSSEISSTSTIMTSLFQRFLCLALVAMPISAAVAQNTKLKVATVDMQDLFKQYHLTKDAQKQIDDERFVIQQANEDRLKRIKEIETNLENFKKQIEDPSINESKKQGLIKDFQLQQQEGIQLDKERRDYIQRRTQALNENMVQRMKSLLEDIRKIVEDRSKADNYDFVFDKSGMSTSQIPILVYSKDATDITQSVLKILNKDAPAEKTPPAKPNK